MPDPVPAPQPQVVAPQPSPPSPEPDEPKVFGKVQVNALNGGQVFVDGEATGRVTPTTLQLPVGTYSVKVEGYAPKTVVIRPNQYERALFK